MLKFLIRLLTGKVILDILKEQLNKIGYVLEKQDANESQEFDSLERIRFVQTPEDDIYWMEDGQMYMTALRGDGMWDPEDGIPVSFENLNRNELEKLIIIMGALTER
jgi:hypothetical protein